ncbi:PAS/PAC domain protein [Ignavibacterium album JCM 16511]|uniref:histidine kinase n=1 Tax=Ignavibacterium album (strain DSM 19864 / JCM 16511 / NBRC 101810 / Mat9-16) TaxID=945713 RepID=I0AMJ0_IGNAJ|nr:PAS domain S-box protein [Ignavibacterium album]AFH50197.1 PAS/PAC domain protein [Ignavibacterium album JCM 16511]
MESNLLSSEKIFEFLAENASDLIYIYRLVPEPKFEYVSPSSTRITGYTPEEHYADPQLGLKLVHPDDLPILQNFLNKNVITEPIILRWKKKDGTLIWTEQINTPIYDSEGNLIAIQGIARDITKRKLDEEKLIESEYLYKYLFEHNPLPMWVYDLETLKFLAVNNASINKYGYSREEFLSMTIKDIRPEEELQALMKNISESKDDLQKSRPWKHKLKNGSIIITEISSHSLNYEGHNARLVLANDITEQIIAEEKIKRLTRVYAVLSEVNQTIVRVRDKKKLLNEVTRIAVEFGKFKLVWLGEFNENTLSVKPVAASGITEDYLDKLDISLAENESYSNPVKYVLNQNKFIIINDFQNDERTKFWYNLAQKYGINSSASFPINIFGKPVYVLSFYADSKNFFDEDEIKLLDELSKDITFALEYIETESEKEKMRADLEYHSNLLSNVNDAIIATDKNLRITYWNEAAEQIYGIKRSEAIGKTTRDVLHTQYLELGRDEILKKLSIEGKYSTRAIQYHKSGRKLYIDAKGFAVKDKSGNIIGYASINRDITVSYEAEMLLRESEEKFRALAESTPAAIFIYQGEYFQYLNPAAENLTGYKLNEIYGMKFFELVHPDHKEMVRERGIKRQLGEEVDNRYIFKIIRKDGEVRWVDFGAEIIEYKGKPAAIGTAYDITDRIKFEESLKESEEKYRLLIENQTDLVVKVDLEGKFLFVSESYCKTFGKTQEELLGNKFLPLVHPDDRESTMKEMEKLYSHPYSCYIEQRALTATGWKWFSWVDTLVFDETGKPTAIIGVGRDITEKKLAEIALRENQEELKRSEEMLRSLTQKLQEIREEERSRIAMELHDELGQVLTAIKIDLNSLIKKPPYKKDIPLKIAPVISLVEDTINTVRKISMELRPVMLDRLGLLSAIEWQIDEIRKRLGIKTLTNLPEGISGLTKEQEIAVFRTFQEIFTNIARHSKATEVAVSLVTDDEKFMMIVRDNGVGFTPESISRKGGLGLLGMKERIKSAGGFMEINSKINSGTEIKIFIPLR